MTFDCQKAGSIAGDVSPFARAARLKGSLTELDPDLAAPLAIHGRQGGRPLPQAPADPAGAEAD